MPDGRILTLHHSMVTVVSVLDVRQTVKGCPHTSEPTVPTELKVGQRAVDGPLPGKFFDVLSLSRPG